jgi:hypothetical protein
MVSMDHLGRAKSQRAEVRSALGELEAAVAAPVADADVWRKTAAGAVDRMETALDAHVDVTEGPDGLFANVLRDAPRLAHGIDVLRREHEELRSAVHSLAERLKGQVDVGEAREDALALMGAIVRHRHRGADLVYDAYQTDLGGG